MVVAAAAEHARAAPPPASAGSRPAAFIILAGGSPKTTAALEKTLRASLRQIGVDATFSALPQITARQVAEAPTSEAPGVVTVWLDLSRAGLAVIYVVRAERVFVRRVPVDDTSDALAQDLLDVVVTSSVRAALGGQQSGLDREEFRRSLEDSSQPAAAPPASPAAPAASPAASPAAPPVAAPAVMADETMRTGPPALSGAAAPGVRRSLVWSVAAFYEGALVATTRAMHGPGFLVDAERGAARVALSFHGRLPYDVAADPATIRLATEGFRLSLTGLVFLRPTWVATGALGAGGDFTYVQTISAAADLAPAAARWVFDPMVRAAAGIERRHGRWRATVVTGVDLDLVGARYSIAGTPASGGDEQPIWVPWRWRPYIALSIAVAL